MFLNRKNSLCFRLLIYLQGISYFLQFLVGNSCHYSTPLTLFNIIFVNVNLFLIIAPWRLINVERMYAANIKYITFFKKALFPLLFFHILINITIFIIILIYIPDIYAFKTEKAFKNLYENIPYFANLFRYAYTSQNTGMLAIPLFFYYYEKKEFKKSLWALFLSSSTLISAFAFYSRALIFTYILVFYAYYLILYNSLTYSLKKKINYSIKLFFVFVGCLFIIITIKRFSAMDYYAERIPKQSIIQDPILYSLVDYASQGYPNGVNLLEDYTYDKNLKGDEIFRTVYQFLSFFNIITWDSDKTNDRIAAAYNYDGGAFHGYTAHMIYNFGYLLTFIMSALYYLFVKYKLSMKTDLSIEKLNILILLLIIPLVSIFYSGMQLLFFPIIVLITIRIAYLFSPSR